MAEIVNLRMARKRRKREAAAAEAEDNRRAHGISNSVKTAREAERRSSLRKLDGHRLDRPQGRDDAPPAPTPSPDEPA